MRPTKFYTIWQWSRYWGSIDRPDVWEGKEFYERTTNLSGILYMWSDAEGRKLRRHETE